ncbi:hypothetical protein EVA_03548 [gut metagenome]|uniref:Uncharacterized protein n=1 Tax=gut metagenome TaxID=749906 RepID=J9D6F7_9ZZZZ
MNEVVLYIREALLSNSSEWRLAEHQADVPDLLPTQESNASENKDTSSSSIKQAKEKTIQTEDAKNRKEVKDNVEEQTVNAVESQANAEFVTIKPVQYITRRGKVLNMQLVTPVAQLGKEQIKQATKFAKEKKGWYDFEKGGFMMRSEEDANAMALFIEEMNVLEQKENVKEPVGQKQADGQQSVDDVEEMWKRHLRKSRAYCQGSRRKGKETGGICRRNA